VPALPDEDLGVPRHGKDARFTSLLEVHVAHEVPGARDVKAAVERLELSAETGRLRRWTVTDGAERERSALHRALRHRIPLPSTTVATAGRSARTYQLTTN
jgi:hypothetical protein